MGLSGTACSLIVQGAGADRRTPIATRHFRPAGPAQSRSESSRVFPLRASAYLRTRCRRKPPVSTGSDPRYVMIGHANRSVRTPPPRGFATRRKGRPQRVEPPARWRAEISARPSWTEGRGPTRRSPDLWLTDSPTMRASPFSTASSRVAAGARASVEYAVEASGRCASFGRAVDRYPWPAPPPSFRRGPLRLRGPRRYRRRPRAARASCTSHRALLAGGCRPSLRPRERPARELADDSPAPLGSGLSACDQGPVAGCGSVPPSTQRRSAWCRGDWQPFPGAVARCQTIRSPTSCASNRRRGIRPP